MRGTIASRCIVGVCSRLLLPLTIPFYFKSPCSENLFKVLRIFSPNYREQLFNFQLDLDLKTHMRKHLRGVERLVFLNNELN